MASHARSGLASIFVLLAATAAAAQEPAFHVAAKGGAAIERAEDGLRGTVPAIGLTVTRRFSPAWRGEVEFWLPGYLEPGPGQRHRDVLLSASAVRLFRPDGVRPFLLAGLTLARTEDEFTHVNGQRVKHAGIGIALTTGGGVEIPITRRMHVVADVRLLLSPGALLLRPAVGLGVGF